jgi:pimeloyl-ACP methyl ester carboxylesterase
VDSIRRARQAWQQPGLRERLARHHDDPDSAFGGWSGAWLDPRFRRWSIEDEIASIACPVLAMQGLQDEYGTLEQVRGIARRVRGTRLLELPGCGHAPHREQPAAVIEAVRHFFATDAGIPGDRVPDDGRRTPAAGAGPPAP